MLDAGALIALDRHDAAMWGRLAAARAARRPLLSHAGIIGQVWRQPARQARLARVVRAIDVRPLTLEIAKQVGLLLAATGHADVHDSALALLCEDGDTVLTSDVDDLGELLWAAGRRAVDIVLV